MLSPKHQLVLFVTLLFVIVGSPLVYGLTDKLFGLVKLDTVDVDGRPTSIGLILHAIVFGLATFAYLKTFQI
jgi:hypothetical protein